MGGAERISEQEEIIASGVGGEAGGTEVIGQMVDKGEETGIAGRVEVEANFKES